MLQSSLIERKVIKISRKYNMILIEGRCNSILTKWKTTMMVFLLRWRINIQPFKSKICGLLPSKRNYERWCWKNTKKKSMCSDKKCVKKIKTTNSKTSIDSWKSTNSTKASIKCKKLINKCSKLSSWIKRNRSPISKMKRRKPLSKYSCCRICPLIYKLN